MVGIFQVDIFRIQIFVNVKKNSFSPNNKFFPAPNYVSEKKVVLYKATFDFFATFFSKVFPEIVFSKNYLFWKKLGIKQ